MGDFELLELCKRRGFLSVALISGQGFAATELTRLSPAALTSEGVPFQLVRSMVPGTTRRATVPAAFGLGGGAPSAPSYLELNVRAVLGKGEYREEERAAQRCDEGEPLPVLCKPPPQQRVGGG